MNLNHLFKISLDLFSKYKNKDHAKQMDPLSQSIIIFFDLPNDPIQQASFFLRSSPVTNSVINTTLYYMDVLNIFNS